MIERLLAPPKRSFFLVGARGTGKSTWLRRQRCLHGGRTYRYDGLDVIPVPTFLQRLHAGEVF